MRYISRKVVLVVAAVVSAVALLAGQEPAQKPRFEVASVKVNDSATAQTTLQSGDGRFDATFATLAQLMKFAYAGEGLFLDSDQIIGGPAWIDTDHFDVDGQWKGDQDAYSQRTRLMVLSVLQDRFRLKAHGENRERPVYNLVIADGGSKLRASDDQAMPDTDKAQPQSDGRIYQPEMIQAERGGTMIMHEPSCTTLIGNSIPVSAAVTSLVTLLEGALSQTVSDEKGKWKVVDGTGLRGLFDVQVRFTPATTGVATSPANGCGQSLSAALQEQLGLKLESAKGPAEVLVIESVQKPSEN